MSSRGSSRGNDDWVCSDSQCGNLNFARRLYCNRCGRDKDSLPSKRPSTEIGKAAAERSRGLFSADDWQCAKCGNVNWARRVQCNVCNAPRVGDVEERTGYGGGYNERENVEYIDREESDGEYDEPFRFERDAYDRKRYRMQSRDNEEIPKLDDRYWCRCGLCEPLEKQLMSVCCREIPAVLKEISEWTNNPSTANCITDHPGFSPLCLNVWVLKVAYMQYRSQYPEGENFQENNERFRYAAYRQFVRWCWGYLGKDIHVAIPACVTLAIRKQFPLEKYGFNYPNLQP